MLRSFSALKPNRQLFGFSRRQILTPRPSNAAHSSKRLYADHASSSRPTPPGWSKPLLAASVASIITGCVVYTLGNRENVRKDEQKPKYATLDEMKIVSF